MNKPTLEIIQLAALAFGGALVSYLVKNKDKPVNFNSLLKALIIGIFTGAVVKYGCAYLGFGFDLTCFVVGITGFMGERALRLLEKLITDWFDKNNKGGMA